MNFKKLLTVAVLATSASVALADDGKFNLTSKDASGNEGGILVKDNYGNCVTVRGNRNLTGCGDVAPAPEVAPQPQPAQVQQVTLGADAFFDFNKSTLKPAGRQAIDELGATLSQRGASLQAVTVVGHTDSKGSDAYNQRLSERRAQTVANYLTQVGVPANIISAYGEGERRPVADNSTDAGRAQNRRVEINIQGVVQQ